MRTHRRGFTLIELLVVISIIGLLSSVVLASLNSARTKAADTQRIANLRQMQAALEVFHTANGRYPGYGDGAMNMYNVSPYNGADCGYQNDWCDFETVMASYIGQLPRDSAGIFSGGARYVYKRNASNPDLYALGVSLDAAHTAAANDGGYHATIYELGPLVSYCMNKYSGSSRAWYNWDGNNLCVGGN